MTADGVPRPLERVGLGTTGQVSAGGGQVLFAGFLGNEDGDRADQRGGGGEQGDPEQSVSGGGAGDEGGGDERGEPAAEGGGQLVAQGRTGVSVPGGEDLGGEC